ncbi:MAG: Ni/Fe hydrogenase subunit alpha [Candidatus Altiarchaeales archaeon ex4484_96]|nr:MAG: Ni/Fe hydrogenase subunit alpha [Candidatus Altiarchaeales archaeon ex4484_96]
MSEKTAKNNKREILISPVTRLEGHAKIDIFLNEEGNVQDAYFQVVELRGFEKFCQGRPVEEMPRITPRICGVCPNPHHMASGKAVDMVFSVEATETAKKLREMSLCAHYMHSHIAHFYALAGPDFVVGPDADPAQRNIIGVIDRVGVEAGKKVIQARAYSQKIQEIISGRATHPINNLPGGIARGISADQRKEIENMSDYLVDFGKFTLETFEDIVLKNKKYVELITGDYYRHETHYMGTVDEKNNVAFYEGNIRVVDPKGREYVKFKGVDYLKHIAEHVEPWSYLKFPYLKNKGWSGFVDGVDSGIYRVAPLARLNVADGMATPLANQAYEKMYDVLGGKPAHETLAMNWARVIEIMYSAERIAELISKPDITSRDVRNIPTRVAGEGVGHVEAPRGTLFHHYWADDEGILTKANILVATGNNNAGICLSVKKAAEKLIKNFKVDQGILNMVEMAFRAYDPCFACATHTLPGNLPLQVKVFDSDKKVIKKISRFEQ